MAGGPLCDAIKLPVENPEGWHDLEKMPNLAFLSPFPDDMQGAASHHDAPGFNQIPSWWLMVFLHQDRA